ncbi:MAG: tetratricopeptide repeat protein [Candidatus Melainabacteria bacterium]|nr:tetratricopeptide repeat protein [Candidatus Melainabacteria bacterium]
MKSPFKIKTKSLVIFTLIAICVFVILKTNSIETIPSEDPTAFAQLEKAISISKFNLDDGITVLESLKELPDYTEYKKNYILARLYEKKKDYKHAILIYEKLLNKNYPLKERVLFHYAQLNALEGNDSTALKSFNKLLRDFPSSKSVPQAKYFLAQT